MSEARSGPQEQSGPGAPLGVQLGGEGGGVGGLALPPTHYGCSSEGPHLPPPPRQPLQKPTWEFPESGPRLLSPQEELNQPVSSSRCSRFYPLSCHHHNCRGRVGRAGRCSLPGCGVWVPGMAPSQVRPCWHLLCTGGGAGEQGGGEGSGAPFPLGGPSGSGPPDTPIPPQELGPWLPAPAGSGT